MSGRKGQEQTGSIGILEHGEHKMVIHGIPVRPCTFFFFQSICRTRSISSKAAEMICKESDLPIVPMKPLTTDGGKGQTYSPFREQNISHTGGGSKDGKCV